MNSRSFKRFFSPFGCCNKRRRIRSRMTSLQATYLALHLVTWKLLRSSYSRFKGIRTTRPLDNSPRENSLTIFKQLDPHSFIHYRTKQATKYMNPRLNFIQIFLRSFIHHRTNHSSFFYPLPSLKIGAELSDIRTARQRTVNRTGGKIICVQLCDFHFCCTFLVC